MRIRAKYLLIALGLFIVEVLIATIFSHSRFIRAYLGDYLVVIMLYCLVKSFYDVPPLVLATSIFVFACGIEIAQYFRLADVLRLRPGSVLSILLGTSFSWVDILMYFAGSLTAYFASIWRFSNPALHDEG
jgi:DNA integrity scanning protein DisA with diadenylate cyclase activity